MQSLEEGFILPEASDSTNLHMLCFYITYQKEAAPLTAKFKEFTAGMKGRQDLARMSPWMALFNAGGSGQLLKLCQELCWVCLAFVVSGLSAG